MSTTTTTYLITGANRGIGLEFVNVLSARPNTKVIATTRSEAKLLNELADERKNIIVLKLAVDDEKSIAEFGKELGKIPNLKIDYYIPNAGLSNSYLPVTETPRDVWVKHWEINTLGPVETLKVVKPFLAPHNKLIFISSIVGSIGYRDKFPVIISAYGSSKLALNFIVKQLSQEYKDSSIVIALHPGDVITDMGNFGQVQIAKQFDFKFNRITTEESVEAQLKIIDNLTQEDTGKFYSYDGSILPW